MKKLKKEIFKKMIPLYEPNISAKDINEVTKALKTKNLSGASKTISDFEKKFNEKYNLKYSLAINNGTSALHLGLLAIGIKKGDEVIIPSLTFIATANAVSYIGAKPVIVDVDPDTYQISIDEIIKNISKKTKAIIPVHLYGNCPDLKKIDKIAKNYNLKVLNDAAEALGTEYLNKSSGLYGDVAIYSFYPNKIITTGEGGMLVTKSKQIYDKAKKLRGQGLISGTNEYKHDILGYNYRMSALSASLGISQLNKINNFLERKIEIFESYKKNLEPFKLEFIKTETNVKNSQWLTVVNFKNHNININDLRYYLFKEGIETKRVFYPIDRQKIYLKSKRCENSYKIYNSSLCLPSFPDLRKSQINFISNKIKNYLTT